MNWILLRGLMRQQKHWGDFPQKLQAIDKGSRVVCLDLPGVGTEKKRIFNPYLPDVVRDLRSRLLLIENPSDGNWGIMGHSLGGMIALQWVSDFPQDFKRLVVMNSSSRDLPLWKRLTLFSTQQVAKIFFEKDITKREKKILEMISNLKKNDPDILKKWIEIEKSSPMDRDIAAEQLLGAAFFKLPKNIQTKALVLASRADRMVNYECSQDLARRIQARIEVHPTSGHDIALDDAGWVLEKIHQWLESF